jgi:hypothetical protein
VREMVTSTALAAASGVKRRQVLVMDEVDGMSGERAQAGPGRQGGAGQGSVCLVGQGRTGWDEPVRRMKRVSVCFPDVRGVESASAAR